ncbi:hypothetical protein ACO34A_00590 [Rhizobium sp. ACO-34A]|nr:ABC transporter permease [Rhizobium sp. ACO-34A]ATN32310.1 hypothetical protein ACO34A_00590 [Rhizobium sp. ACO-34A]
MHLKMKNKADGSIRECSRVHKQPGVAMTPLRSQGSRLPFRGSSPAIHPGFLVLPAIALLLIVYVFPLLQLLRLSVSDAGPGVLPGSGFTLSQYAAFFADPTSQRVIWRSVWVALLTTVITLLIAFPYATSMVRCGPAMRRILVCVALLPMTTSGVVRAYGMIMILGANGPINQALMAMNLISEPLRILYGPAALIMGNVYFCLPFVILPLAAGVSKLDQRLFDAATTLGAGRIQVFYTVALPLLVPAIAAGSMIAFTLTMTSYITPGLLAGQGYLVITTLLGQKMFELANWVSGAVVSTVLLVCVLCLSGLYQSWIEKRSKFYAAR